MMDPKTMLGALVQGDWAGILRQLDADDVQTVRAPGDSGPAALTVARFGTRVVSCLTDPDGDSSLVSEDHANTYEAQECLTHRIEQADRARVATDMMGAAARQVQEILLGHGPMIDIPDLSSAAWTDPAAPHEA